MKIIIKPLCGLLMVWVMAPGVRAVSSADKAAKDNELIAEMKTTMKDANEMAMMRKVAIHGLVKLCGKEVIPDLVILLKDNNAEIRMESALALGKLGAQEALLDIKGLLMDDNSEVQASAAIALGRLGNKEEAITYLRKLIKKGKNPDARGAAAQGLAEFGVKDAIPDMINLIREKIDGTYGDGISGDRHCIEALGVLDAKEAIPDLIKLFRMEVANGRSSDQLSKIKSGMRVRDLADTLGRLGAREIAAEIIPLLNDREYEFYLDDLIKSLGGFGDKAAIPELAKFLKHAGDQPGDVRIRGWAAVSLIELGARNQVPNELAKDLKSIIRWNDADEFLYDKNRARNALKTLSSGSEAPK